MDKKLYNHNRYLKYRERALVRQKKYYKENREKVVAYRKKYNKDNKEKRNEYVKLMNRKIKQEIIIHYGGKCVCCGEAQMEFLCIDHINGGGNKHRKELGSTSVYVWLRRNGFPSKGFQVLCHNCNQAKGYYGRCPHQ